MEKDKTTSRQEKIEKFLLDPNKEIFNSLQEFNDSVNYIKSLIGNLDLNELEKIQGKDGSTPELGVDYLTDEDLDKIDQYIQDRIKISWSNYPTKEEINSTITNKVNSEVAKIPRVKGEKGDDGKNGNNGSPDTAEQIIEKLRSLSKNKKLNVSDIRGLQNELNRIAQESESSLEELRKEIGSYRIAMSAPTSDGGSGIEDIDGLIEAGTNITITGSGTLADPFVISATCSAGSGDVVGPASAVDGNFASYNTTTGKLIKDSGKKASDFAPALTSDENYVTDAQLVVIGNTSGTNTGDNATNITSNSYADGKVEDSIVDGHTTVAPSGNSVFDALALKAPLASPIFTGNLTTPTVKITGGTPGVGKVLTSDADGDATWETPTPATSLWTAITGTRVSNTTITVATDLTAIFKKGMIVRWTESAVDKVGMVSIPSTYGSPNTTITIIGDTCASIDANSFKYSSILGAEQFIKNFAVAGNIGAVATDVANAYYATEPMRVLGADLQVGTAGTTNNTTIDINIAGTTCFTTKPTLATTVVASPTPFTADSATSLTLNQRVSIDIDAIQTINAVDLYVQLYLLPTRYLNLV